MRWRIGIIFVGAVVIGFHQGAPDGLPWWVWLPFSCAAGWFFAETVQRHDRDVHEMRVAAETILRLKNHITALEKEKVMTKAWREVS